MNNKNLLLFDNTKISTPPNYDLLDKKIYDNIKIVNDEFINAYIKNNFCEIIYDYFIKIENIETKKYIFSLFYLYKNTGLIIFDKTLVDLKQNIYDSIISEIKNENFYVSNDFVYSKILSNYKIKELIIDNFINHFNNKTHNIDYNKINFIDKIIWINLEGSIKRKNYMEDIFKFINIKSERIIAINGSNIVNFKYDHTLTPGELGCVLSHIKSISSLENCTGEYFMICEDDISLNNTILINKTLKDIILNAPKFDILLIQKIYKKSSEKNYIKWHGSIFGSACYIISKTGIKKFINQIANYHNNEFQILKKIDVADKFVYKYLNTYVYKYNFITTLTEESTIHDWHIKLHEECNLNQLKNIIIDLF